MDEFKGVGREEVLQYSGAKWGDCDNDNVRSALAGGLLWLMDALIISKQELQWFAYVVCAYNNRPFLGTITQKVLLRKIKIFYRV